ncbi:MAG TPA: efflux RND transporter periplasmic adaptor subunit [Candidatus Binataceae bacterium]|nr:efflux RND transporter periplasmic adaptor subunit [Candidatus Binataceae bacterium]
MAAAVVAAASFFFWWAREPDPVRFAVAQVTRGPVVRSVAATGTVNPVTTVQVGTYVSGPIIAIYVDFNSRVRAGTLMAKIDPRPFAAQVALSRAALANSQAQLRKDEANLAYQRLTYRRDAVLLKEAAISQDQLDNQRSVFDQAAAQIGLDKASAQQQTASLSAAQLNLNYTNIIAPVDGTVVSRNVDVGQTVAASFQTPTLFLVAKDLTKMQVDTNVSESDVGGVRIGDAVDFTVDAYNSKVFRGVVAQVRQAPITVQNVVTYDVVVNVPNPELLLMPGMTANVSIVTARHDDVLRVPLQALNFSPRRATEDSSPRPESDQHFARVWIDDDGRLHPMRIARGVDDGTNVEVIGGDLKAGDSVVTGKSGPERAEGRRPAFSRGLHLPHM